MNLPVSIRGYCFGIPQFVMLIQDSISKPPACFIYCFLQNFVFIAAAALGLRVMLDSDAVWVACPIGEVLTTLAIVALAAILKRGLPRKAKDFLFLKEPFGAPADEVGRAARQQDMALGTARAGLPGVPPCRPL